MGQMRNDSRHYVPTDIQVQVPRDSVDERHDRRNEVSENNRTPEMSVR
jgi:hypothetical protein